MTSPESSGPLLLFSQAVASEREQLLLGHPRLARPSTVHALYDIVSSNLRADLTRARAAAEAALWLSERLKDPDCEALSLRALGNVHLLSGKPQIALAEYSRALTLFEASSLDYEVAHTRLNLVSANLRIGNFDAAHALAVETRRLMEALDDTRGLARLDNNLGSLYFAQERYEKARKHWQAALNAFRSLDEKHDAAISLRNLAVCEISLNNFRSAQEIYEEVSAYCKKHQLSILLHEIDYNIAYLYYLRGDFEQALDGYRKARTRSQALGDDYHAALCDLDEAELYLELNLLGDAAELARRASSAFRHLQKPYEAAKALAFSAIATWRLGSEQEALALLHQAHRAFSSNGQLAWAALTLLYQALVYYRDGRYFEANRSASAADQLFLSLKLHGKTALSRLLLARLELDRHNTARSAQLIEGALHLLATTELPHITFQALVLLGQVREAEGKLNAARDLYYDAEKILQLLRSQQAAATLHIPILQDRLVVYDYLLHLEAALQEPDHLPAVAFSLIERAKARSLSDLLGARASTLDPKTPTRSRLVEQVRSLREELRWYYTRLARTELQPADATPTPRSPELAVDTLEDQLLASLKEIAKEDLEFGSLHHSFQMQLDEAQRLLAPEEALLEYFVGQDVVYLLFLSPRTQLFLPIAVTPQVSELHRLLAFQLSRSLSSDPEGAKSERTDRLVRQNLERLYTELVASVEEHLAGVTQVTVIPHGFLCYLPFHALVKNKLELYRDLSVAYAPSVASLFFSRQRSTTATSSSVLLFEPSDRCGDQSSVWPEENWEVELVSHATPRQQWEARLREPRRLVHFPLEVTYRLDSPLLSGVRVAGQDMTFLDLFQLEIQADVLVITGSGLAPTRATGGDEFFGLVRALLYSGPRTLVLPLWQCTPRAASCFLKNLAAALSTRSSTSEAIKAAYRHSQGELTHASAWAAWAAYGSADIRPAAS